MLFRQSPSQQLCRCYRDVGGTRIVRRIVSSTANFNIISLDHTKNNEIPDTFTTRSTELSWKLGRPESKQHQASCASPRLPRRSRRDCVGNRLNSQFGSRHWSSVFRDAVFLHKSGAFQRSLCFWDAAAVSFQRAWMTLSPVCREWRLRRCFQRCTTSLCQSKEVGITWFTLYHSSGDFAALGTWYVPQTMLVRGR